MKQAIIIDIDFTLVDSQVPILLLTNAITRGDTPEDSWDVFYENIDLCTKNYWCYKLIDQMTLNTDITVLFITGRNELVKKQTEKLLKFSHKIKYELYMREANDLRSDSEIKASLVEELLTRYEILFAIDDQEGNCEVFKSFGIPTLKVW